MGSFTRRPHLIGSVTEYSAEPRLITLTYVLKHTGRTARGGGHAATWTVEGKDVSKKRMHEEQLEGKK